MRTSEALILHKGHNGHKGVIFGGQFPTFRNASFRVHKRALRVLCELCVFILIACVSSSCNDIERPPLLPYLVSVAGSAGIGIVTSDLSGAGNFVTMSLEGVPRIGQRSIHSDAVVHYEDGRVYIVNRLGRDNIQILNPDAFFATEREFSVGSGANPHGFEKINDGKAFVTLYEQSDLLIVNPATGAETGRVSLAAYADADGIPEMSGMVQYGDSLYVAIQRLDRNDTTRIFPPTAYSSLIQIDVNNEGVIAEHVLPSTNPFSDLEVITLFGQAHILVAGSVPIRIRTAGSWLSTWRPAPFAAASCIRRARPAAISSTS